MYNQILQGDVLDQIKKIADQAINCIVTSPPYYGLRDYGLPPTSWPEIVYEPMAGLPAVTIPAMTCCLGQEEGIEAYVGHIVLVWRELWRVLRGDGVAWLNLGDSYANVGKWGGSTGGKHAKGLHGNSSIGRQKKDYGNLKPKDLMGIPWRVAFALQADGWYLRSDVIWDKKNPMPESVTDRPTKAHEYLFLLTKSAKYWFDQDAIRDGNKREWGENNIGPKNMSSTGIATGKILGRKTMPHSGLVTARPNPAGRNKRTVWTLATKPYAGAHFAVMPEALVEPCLLAGCPSRVCVECGMPWVRVVEKVKGDNPENFNGSTFTNGKTSVAANALSSVGQKPRTVARKTVDYAPTCACDAPHHPGIILDPFFGSGTVAVVAENLKRYWLGIELNPAYIELARRRIERTQPALFAR